MGRATSTPVAVVLLVAVVTSAGLVGATVVGAGGTAPEPVPTTRLALTADASADRITVTHQGGDALNVTALRVRVSVDGTSLSTQPPVPFFAAAGFRSGPTGPFNSGANPTWTAGERATVRIASTNSPSIDPGDVVRVVLATDAGTVATLEARAT